MGLSSDQERALTLRLSTVTFESHFSAVAGPGLRGSRGWGGGWEGAAECREPPDRWPWKAGSGQDGRLGG